MQPNLAVQIQGFIGSYNVASNQDAKDSLVRGEKMERILLELEGREWESRTRET